MHTAEPELIGVILFLAGLAVVPVIAAYYAYKARLAARAADRLSAIPADPRVIEAYRAASQETVAAIHEARGRLENVKDAFRAGLKG